MRSSFGLVEGIAGTTTAGMGRVGTGVADTLSRALGGVAAMAGITGAVVIPAGVRSAVGQGAVPVAARELAILVVAVLR
jgi:hypothetical protein